jgi:hypothetical protein
VEEAKPLNGLTQEVEEHQSIFQPGEGEDINTVTLMRIYDMLGAISTQLDAILTKMSDEPEDLTDDVLEAHANGKLIGPLPSLNL